MTRGLPAPLRAALLAGATLAALLWSAAPVATGQPAAPAAPAAATLSPLVRVSAANPFPADCIGPAAGGVNYRNAAVEPQIAVDPRDSNHLMATWQQDRWSNGGAAGNAGAVSRDGGRSWTPSYPPHSRCAGGTAANGGDFDRASDPWVSFALNGDLYFISLALQFSQEENRPVTSAVLVSRSTDGGRSWDPTVTLARDPPPFFHDKETVTADPLDSSYAYAVWDRVNVPTREDAAVLAGLRGGQRPTPEQQAALDRTRLAPRVTMFARTTDGGRSWEPARPILTLRGQQSISNQVLVLPDGALLNVFALLSGDSEEDAEDGSSVADAETSVALQRSTDHGESWSAPVIVAPMDRAGVTDPETKISARSGPLVQAAVDPRSGAVFLVWQDSRAAGDTYDEVVLALSTDGGRSWSAPVVVSRGTGGPSFVPGVAVLPDGVIGVTYYDFRRIEPQVGAPPVNYWLTLCHAACTERQSWEETPVGRPFDLTTAARVGQRTYFLGDYEGLAAAGDTFAVLFVRAGTAGSDTASDVYFAIGTPAASSGTGSALTP